MSIFAIAPYLLAPLALIVGIMIERFWWARRRSSSGGPHSRLGAESEYRARVLQLAPPAGSQQESLLAAVERGRQEIQDAESRLKRIDARLDYLNEAIEAARCLLKERDSEYARLVVELDEHRSAVADLESKLHQVEQQRDSMLETIARRLEELDLLSTLSAKWEADVDRLTQHLQWQDGHLSRLRQAINERSADLDEAENLLAQRDDQLQRLIRLRQSREAALLQTESFLDQYDTRLAELVQRGRQNPSDFAVGQQVRAASHPARAARAGRLYLPAGPKAISPAQSGPDDLTRIRGLVEVYAERLREAGIESYAQLAQAQPDEIMAILRTPGHLTPDVQSWIRKAQEFLSQGPSG